MLNEDKTTCICPSETHYKIVPTGADTLRAYGEGSTSCMQKGEYVYYVKFDANNCIGDFSHEVLSWEPTGFWWYIESNGKYYQNMYFEDDNLGSSFFQENTLIKHDDGEIEVTFVTDPMLPGECHDWKEITTNLIRGYGHGKSTLGNTKLDIEVIYKNKNGVVVDTAYIHLWKT